MSIATRAAALTILTAGCCSTIGVSAAEPSDRDPAAYSLFDPTPQAYLRPFCADRPTRSTAPCTVDPGHVQIESDAFSVTFDHTGGLTTTTWLATNPTVKLGLAESLDFEVNIAPYETVTIAGSSATRSLDGVGDLFLRLKWNMLSVGAVGMAIAPFVKIPTAKLGLGDGAYEGGALAPISLRLSDVWSLTLDPEADILADARGGGHHLGLSALACLNAAVSKTVTISAELWADQTYDPAATITQSSIDLGLAYIPAKTPDLQFDGGVNLGLNHQTPGLQAYVGVSHRF